MLNDFIKQKSFITLTYKYFKYKRKFKHLPINKSKNCLKVGIIGELYTSMEPFASYFIEKELAKEGYKRISKPLSKNASDNTIVVFKCQKIYFSFIMKQ